MYALIHMWRGSLIKAALVILKYFAVKGKYYHSAALANFWDSSLF